MTTEEFIAKATSKHGNRYDYSKVVYTRSTDKVLIVCSIHGEFSQTPHKHLQGCGCQMCGLDAIKKKATGTLQNFLNRATKKHGNKYDYSKVNYVSAKSKVTIICPIHGEFEQTPDSHSRGSGCTKCNNDATAERMIGNRNVSVEKFKKRAASIHGNKYDYTKVVFSLTKEKVSVTCPIHGDFELSVNKHLLGKACPKCSMIHRVQNGWSTSIWQEAGALSKNFVAYSVYVIKCYNCTESFYKIGKTFKQITKRVQKFKEAGYDVEVLKTFTGTAEEMSLKEKEMHKKNSHNKYTPNNTFCGMQECYSEVCL